MSKTYLLTDITFKFCISCILMKILSFGKFFQQKTCRLCTFKKQLRKKICLCLLTEMYLRLFLSAILQSPNPTKVTHPLRVLKRYNIKWKTDVYMHILQVDHINNSQGRECYTYVINLKHV